MQSFTQRLLASLALSSVLLAGCARNNGANAKDTRFKGDPVGYTFDVAEQTSNSKMVQTAQSVREMFSTSQDVNNSITDARDFNDSPGVIAHLDKSLATFEQATNHTVIRPANYGGWDCKGGDGPRKDDRMANQFCEERAAIAAATDYVAKLDAQAFQTNGIEAKPKIASDKVALDALKASVAEIAGPPAYLYSESPSF